MGPKRAIRINLLWLAICTVWLRRQWPLIWTPSSSSASSSLAFEASHHYLPAIFNELTNDQTCLPHSPLVVVFSLACTPNQGMKDLLIIHNWQWLESYSIEKLPLFAKLLFFSFDFCFFLYSPTFGGGCINFAIPFVTHWNIEDHEFFWGDLEDHEVYCGHIENHEILWEHLEDHDIFWGHIEAMRFFVVI